MTPSVRIVRATHPSQAEGFEISRDWVAQAYAATLPQHSAEERLALAGSQRAKKKIEAPNANIAIALEFLAPSAAVNT